MTSVCQRLVDLGVYASSGPGRPSLYTSEEAQRVKKSRLRSLQIERRALCRSARQRGEPRPTFKRGRRPLYSTRDEAIAAKRLQDKEARIRFKARLLQALDNLATQVGDKER